MFIKIVIILLLLIVVASLLAGRMAATPQRPAARLRPLMIRIALALLIIAAVAAVAHLPSG